MQLTTDISASRTAEAPQGGPLQGAAVLVVEDEVLLAQDLVSTIEENGGRALGPIHRLGDAMGRDDLDGIDCALLDVDIAGEEVFAFADTLAAADVPIVFHTARTDISHLEARYPGAGVICKPCLARGLVAALSAAMFRPGSAGRAAS